MVCSVDGCNKERWARGLCPMHLMRLRTRGEVGGPEPEINRPTEPCIVDDCTRLRRSRNGMCGMHYQRWRKYGDPGDATSTFQPDRRCTVDGCDEPFYARGRCGRHYRQWYSPTRRAALKLAPGEATEEAVTARVNYFGGRCWICGGQADTLDHVKPLKAGGSNWPANLRPACRSCNAQKSAKWYGVKRLAEVVA